VALIKRRGRCSADVSAHKLAGGALSGRCGGRIRPGWQRAARLREWPVARSRKSANTARRRRLSRRSPTRPNPPLAGDLVLAVAGGARTRRRHRAARAGLSSVRRRRGARGRRGHPTARASDLSARGCRGHPTARARRASWRSSSSPAPRCGRHDLVRKLCASRRSPATLQPRQAARIVVPKEVAMRKCKFPDGQPVALALSGGPLRSYRSACIERRGR
jgi:hypothetical protein